VALKGWELHNYERAITQMGRRDRNVKTEDVKKMEKELIK
jgi:hypothetical protein